jgi:hypothetical protein
VSRLQRSARSISVRKAMYEGLIVKIVLRALSPLRPFARIFFVSTYSHVLSPRGGGATSVDLVARWVRLNWRREGVVGDGGGLPGSNATNARSLDVDPSTRALEVEPTRGRHQ